MIAEWKLQINSAGHTHCAPDWHWGTTKNPYRDFDLWMVTAGRGNMFTSTETYSLSKGDCFILRPGDLYKGETHPDQTLSVMHIHFDVFGPDGDLLFDEVRENLHFHRKLFDTSFLMAMVGRAISAWTTSEAPQTAATPWLKTALLEIQRQDEEQYVRRNPTLEAIDSACRSIDANPGGYRVGELAHANGLSPDHFTRLFKKFKGCSPIQYIQRVRINHACALLLNSNLSIAQIAEDLSFRDAQHFCHTFKARQGVSPARFRKSGYSH